MAPLLSITTLLLFLSLFLSFSTPSLSVKTLLPTTNKNPLPTKKILQVQEEQEEDEQPVSKPKKTQLPTKKSKQASDEEEEQPISKPKKSPLPTKKSKQTADDEEEQPISKPKKNQLPTKKSKQVDDQEEEQPTSKPKKNPLPTKKPKESEEEQPISKPKKTSLPTKKPKEVVKEDEEEEQPIPKSKPKKTPSDNLKNQTKLLKPKKPKSNSTTTTTTTPTPKTTQSSKFQSPPAAAAAKKIKIQNPKQTDNPDPIWLDDPSEDEDILSEFRDLPTRIQSSLLPDLRKISITSRAYIYRANRELATRVKPFVGTSFAPRVALAGSCVLLLLLPLLLLALLFYHLNSCVSLHRFLLFVHAYLAVYFLTLSLSALAMGLEPLRFFHATSPSAYAWMQAVQTLAYVLYLLALVINLLVVFSSSGSGAGAGGEAGAKTLALTQVAVGLAVGMHYYAAVFHRAVAGEPPRAGWKVHAVYAACFLVVCAFARDAERRKKAYDGGEDGKKN